MPAPQDLPALPEDAVVLITGAARGIGRATAERLAARGFRVIAATRQLLDVADDASVAAAFSGLTRLDAIVCNAGYASFGAVEELSVAAAQRQFEVNYLGVVRTIRAALPLMTSGGRILVVGSLAGRAPIPFQAHYSASKAALDALVQSLAIELRPRDIRVALIEPGDIATEFNDTIDWGDLSQSRYQPAIGRTRAVIEASVPRGPPADAVARVIERALTARRPRLRYTVGRSEAWLVPLARRLFPERLNLWLIRCHFRA